MYEYSVWYFGTSPFGSLLNLVWRLGKCKWTLLQIWRNTETKAGFYMGSRWVEQSLYFCTGRIRPSGMVQFLWRQCARCCLNFDTKLPWIWTCCLVSEAWIVSNMTDIRESETAPGGDYPPDSGGGDHPKVEDRPHQRRHWLCIQGPRQAREGQ